MIPKKTVERLIPILRKDVNRARRLKVPGFPAVYYCAFLLRDINWFKTWAASGSVVRKRSDHTRNVYCDLRIGSYGYDQVREGGLSDNEEEDESTANISVPIDDKHYGGLRTALWRLTDARFRDSVAEYKDKQVAEISRSGRGEALPSFTRLPPCHFISSQNPEHIDEDAWEAYCKKASKWLSGLPHVSMSSVEFDASQITRIFVSTERRIIVQNQQIFSLTATMKRVMRDGSQITQELVFNCGTQRELPPIRTFQAAAREKHARLLKLSRARKLHAFSGPALLLPDAAGTLFHEAIGHRMEGSRLLSSSEGLTFKGHIDERILTVDLSIRDNPRLKRFQRALCIGAYDYDDEGAESHEALLVADGAIKDFLTTRQPVLKRRHRSNGHARSEKFQRPISRMAVTIVEGRITHSRAQLKAQLIEEIRKQKKPFGLIVYEVSEAETGTANYDFQAFSGNISFATLLYPDGREVCVRGVDFVGTPLQALSNVIAVGNDQELNNSFCGAESGMVPISTISPSILLSNLELQLKADDSTSAPTLLPRPRL